MTIEEKAVERLKRHIQGARAELTDHVSKRKFAAFVPAYKIKFIYDTLGLMLVYMNSGPEGLAEYYKGKCKQE